MDGQLQQYYSNVGYTGVLLTINGRSRVKMILINSDDIELLLHHNTTRKGIESTTYSWPCFLAELQWSNSAFCHQHHYSSFIHS